MSAFTTEASGRAPWQTFLGWFAPPDEARAEPARHSMTETYSFDVPAQGEAFAFVVEPTLWWSVDGGTKDYLAQRAADRSGTARRGLRRLAAGMSRRFPPHQAEAFEAALNDELTGRRPWSVGEGALVLSCDASVRVHPDERILDQTREFWEKRVAMECEHDLEVRRAALVNELIGTWAAVIEKLEANPFASPSAKLAEENFAEIFAAFKQQRGDAGRRLVDILERAVRGTEMRMGPSEYTKAWDAALTALLKEYGK